MAKLIVSSLSVSLLSFLVAPDGIIETTNAQLAAVVQGDVLFPIDSVVREVSAELLREVVVVLQGGVNDGSDPQQRLPSK